MCVFLKLCFWFTKIKGEGQRSVSSVARVELYKRTVG